MSMMNEEGLYDMGPEYKRTDVRVTAVWDEQGTITPKQIHWRDGRDFDVRVINRANRPVMKVGGCGVRYTILVTYRGLHLRNNLTYLFHEKGAIPEVWFVEEEIPFE